MKTLVISLSFLLVAATIRAQSAHDTIVVAPGPSGMYFYHIVQKGESLQSLSQQFGVRQDQLTMLNKQQSLQPYEMIKIPLNKNNILQSGNASANAELTPLYHKVLKGETLFRVGKLYGDIPLSSLRDWNNLQGNTISVGQYLVVGWLQRHPVSEKTADTSPSSPTSSPTAIADNPPEPDTPPASNHSAAGNAFLREVIAAEKKHARQVKLQTDTPVAHPLLTPATAGNNQQDSQPQDTPQPVSRPLLTANTRQIPKQEKTPDATPPEHHVQQPPPTASPSRTGAANTSNPFEKMLNQITGKKKEETSHKSPAVQPPAQTAPTPAHNQQTVALPATETATPPKPVNKKDTAATLQLSRESLFSELYLAQTQGEKLTSSKKGAAGWFKSNVKPGSKKYYALCNDLPRGTIVKVVNPINKKFVYVKVLAPIPEQKENYNLIIKLSDAAMSDLGTNQPRFWSKIVYPRLNENAAN